MTTVLLIQIQHCMSRRPRTGKGIKHNITWLTNSFQYINE